MIKKFLLIFLLLVIQPSLQAATQITKVRTWNSPEHTRVVLELSDAVTYKIFQLHQPERVVVEMEKTDIDVSTLSALANKGALSSVRYAKKGKKELQKVSEISLKEWSRDTKKRIRIQAEYAQQNTDTFTTEREGSEDEDNSLTRRTNYKLKPRLTLNNN